MSNVLALHPIAATYWREEIRLNSPHLARLQRICAERGADYAATVATLISSGIAALRRQMTYVLAKTSGRGAGLAPLHEIGPDGSSALCGARIRDEQWSLWPRQPKTAYGRKMCQRCTALLAAQMEAREAMNNALPQLTSTPEIDQLLQSHAPVAIGVSGGKDSSATALALIPYLDALGHQGPRVLIHSDLGAVEWKDSLPTCERLAARLGLELITVRRHAGGMLERWQTRWANNVARYANLECVKLILPWSTAAMRFCTSELKTAIICRELVQRFSGQTILSVSGIRREESTKRQQAPIAKEQPKLTSATHGTHGYDWHPLLDWTKADVFALHERAGFPLHEAYRVYGSSRVSCAFCILGSQADLFASARCADNADVYRAMVDLEIASTFSFQERWLGDVAPHLLGADRRRDLREAKQRAARREAAEARIPPHLLYTKGWPTVMPTVDEARLLCEVRQTVSSVVEIDIQYARADDLLARYAELMDARPAALIIPSTTFRQELMAL